MLWIEACVEPTLEADSCNAEALDPEDGIVYGAAAGTPKTRSGKKEKKRLHKMHGLSRSVKGDTQAKTNAVQICAFGR